MLAFALVHFRRYHEIDGILLVALEGWLDYCQEMAAVWHLDKLAAVAPCGTTSQESIRIGPLYKDNKKCGCMDKAPPQKYDGGICRMSYTDKLKRIARCMVDPALYRELRCL